MGNTIALVSLSIWPILVILFLSKFGFVLGVLFSVLLSYLFLPVGYDFNFKGFPVLDKGTITILTIILYMFFKGKYFDFSDFGFKSKLVIFFIILSPLLTTLSNFEPYMHLRGMSFYDGVSMAVSNLLIIAPFFIALKFFRTYESHVQLFKYFLIIMTIYSVLIIFEIRFSPQLHRIIYGYHPHEFVQQIRSGGYRAVVFVGHGLLVALLVSIALLVSASLYKLQVKVLGCNSLYFVFFYMILLFLSKSYAAFFYGFLGVIVILFFKSKLIILISGFFALLFILYPALSILNMFPHEAIVSIASNFSVERAQSLNFRFYHESNLLAHAFEKFWTGWGSWGRNRVYDPITFSDLSVTDGRWIITFGMRGLIGFFVEYYFLIVTISSNLFLIRYSGQIENKELLLCSFHSLIVCFILIDQIPNASLGYFYWFFAGCLFARVSHVLKEVKNKRIKDLMNK